MTIKRIGMSIDDFRRRHQPPDNLDPSAPLPDEGEAIPSRDEIADRRRAQRQDEWERLCPPRFTGVTFDALDQPEVILGDLRDWLAAARCGKAGNLLLFGPLGVGKTYVALALLRELHAAGASAGFFPVVEMLDSLRRDGREKTLDEYTSPDFVVLDDLGAEKPSEWTQERFYVVVNRRWLDCKATIGTCNFDDPANLREAVGARSYDRLLDGATALNFAGVSRRRPA